MIPKIINYLFFIRFLKNVYFVFRIKIFKVSVNEIFFSRNERFL